ncbi:GNAT family N-acetyltransferase [Streptomyces zhihengii]
MGEGSGVDGEVQLVRVDADVPRLVWELHTPLERVGFLDALDRGAVWVTHIGVDPRYRGRGHATRLLSALLTHAGGLPVGLAAAPFPSWRQRGLQHDALRAWYARHGFHPDPVPGDPYRMLRPAAAP